MNRHEMIGIKQAIRFEWMEKTSELRQTDKPIEEIRQDLRDYLSERMGRGTIQRRSETARDFAIGILMRTWVTPDTILISIRDEALSQLSHASDDEQTAIHHCIISAAYPFWYAVSRQIGALFRLQDQITVRQIVQRTKEVYGDRQTVDRNTRFVIRSLYYWGFLEETGTTGCYRKGKTHIISSETLRRWMIEAQLHAIPEGRATLSALQNDPALFAFDIPYVSGTTITRNHTRLELMQNGGSDEMMMLKS